MLRFYQLRRSGNFWIIQATQGSITSFVRTMSGGDHARKGLMNSFGRRFHETPSQGEPMKNVYEVLQQKEKDLARVRHEIESLRIVASLLSEELTSEEPTRKRCCS